jgi:hypothetical protein
MDLVVGTSRSRTRCLVRGPRDGVPLLLVHGDLTTEARTGP